MLPKKPVLFGKPVELPKIYVGKSYKVLSAEAIAKILEANHRLRDDDAFWDKVEAKYGMKRSEIEQYLTH